MSDTKPQLLEIGSNTRPLRQIAYHHQIGHNKNDQVPGIMWLPGFHSTMMSTKSTALANWCARQNLTFTTIDYSGHGQSTGSDTDGTISDWVEEAGAILDKVTTGPQILVGSSMGGWIALLLQFYALKSQLKTTGKIRGIVLIAPAWDMTQGLIWPNLPEEAKLAIATEGVYFAPSNYDIDRLAITKDLIEDGKNHLLADRPFDPGLPVRILHGRKDPDVPWKHSLALLDLLQSDDAVLNLIADGDHRLSRDQDLDRLFYEIKSLVDRVSAEG